MTVTISATEGDGWIALNVTDDGEKCVDTEQHGNGIGLANVRDRLEARYGSAARLVTEKGEQGCFRATITIDTEPKDLA